MQYLNYDSNPRHLLSKGALARLTNSDGLTAEVDLMIIMMINMMIIMMIIKIINHHHNHNKIKTTWKQTDQLRNAQSRADERMPYDHDHDKETDHDDHDLT